MAIPRISAAVLRYLHSFGLASVGINSRGTVVVVSNPVGLHQAWWLPSADAGRLKDAAEGDGNVDRAARELRLRPTPHDVALMRADRALARLDAIIDEARTSGGLKRFNDTYRERRAAALAAGRNFMPYSTCERRLRRALADVIAKGSRGEPFTLALHQVLDVG